MFAGLSQRSRKAFPVVDSVKDLVKREWDKLDKGFLPSAAKRRYPFEDDTLSKWMKVPKIDAAVASTSKTASLPLEDVGLLKDPSDRKADMLLKKLWESSSGAFKPAIAGTFTARSIMVWVIQLEEQLKAKGTRMDNQLGKVKTGTDKTSNVPRSSSRLRRSVILPTRREEAEDHSKDHGSKESYKLKFKRRNVSTRIFDCVYIGGPVKEKYQNSEKCVERCVEGRETIRKAEQWQQQYATVESNAKTGSDAEKDEIEEPEGIALSKRSPPCIDTLDELSDCSLSCPSIRSHRGWKLPPQRHSHRSCSSQKFADSDPKHPIDEPSYSPNVKTISGIIAQVTEWTGYRHFWFWHTLPYRSVRVSAALPQKNATYIKNSTIKQPEERVSLTLPGLEEEDEEGELDSEFQSPRGSARLLKNLHMDIGSLGFEYEESERRDESIAASGTDEGSEPELQNLGQSEDEEESKREVIAAKHHWEREHREEREDCRRSRKESEPSDDVKDLPKPSNNGLDTMDFGLGSRSLEKVLDISALSPEPFSPKETIDIDEDVDEDISDDHLEPVKDLTEVTEKNLPEPKSINSTPELAITKDPSRLSESYKPSSPSLQTAAKDPKLKAEPVPPTAEPAKVVDEASKLSSDDSQSMVRPEKEAVMEEHRRKLQELREELRREEEEERHRLYQEHESNLRTLEERLEQETKKEEEKLVEIQKQKLLKLETELRLEREEEEEHMKIREEELGEKRKQALEDMEEAQEEKMLQEKQELLERMKQEMEHLLEQERNMLLREREASKEELREKHRQETKEPISDCSGSVLEEQNRRGGDVGDGGSAGSVDPAADQCKQSMVPEYHSAIPCVVVIFGTAAQHPSISVLERLEKSHQEDMERRRAEVLERHHKEASDLQKEDSATPGELYLAIKKMTQALDFETQMKDLLQEKRDALQSDHKRKVERMKEEHEQVLERTRNQLEDEEQRQRSQMLEKLTDELERIMRLHEEELEIQRREQERRLEERQRGYQDQENKLQELEQNLEIRRKQLVMKTSQLDREAEALAQKREDLEVQEKELETKAESVKSRETALVEQRQLNELIQLKHRELEEVQDQKAELEAQLENLQGRCGRLQKMANDLEEEVRKKRKEPKKEESEDPGETELRVEDLVKSEGLIRTTSSPYQTARPNASVTPVHIPALDSSIDDMRSYISSQGASIQRAKDFLRLQTRSMCRRQTVLKAAKQQWRHNVHESQDLQESLKLDGIRRNLEEICTLIDSYKIDKLHVSIGVRTIERDKQNKSQESTYASPLVFSRSPGVLTYMLFLSFLCLETTLLFYGQLRGPGLLSLFPQECRQFTGTRRKIRHLSHRQEAIYRSGRGEGKPPDQHGVRLLCTSTQRHDNYCIHIRAIIQESRNLKDIRSTMEKGHVLLQEKEQRLQELEDSLLEEVSEDDTLKSRRNKKFVTFDVSDSDDTSSGTSMDAHRAADVSGSQGSLPLKVQHLTQSLRHLTAELNSVLSSLSSDPHAILQPPPAMTGIPVPAYASLSRISPDIGSHPLSPWAWRTSVHSSAASASAAQTVDAIMAEKWRKYFPGAIVPEEHLQGRATFHLDPAVSADKVVPGLRLPSFTRWFSPFHLNEDTVLPSFCPVPIQPLEQSLNRLDLVRAVRISLASTAAFRKLDSLFAIPDGGTPSLSEHPLRTENKLGYISAEEQLKNMQSVTLRAQHADKQTMQAMIETNKKWLETYKNDPKVLLPSRMNRSPTGKGVLQLGLDENDKIKVYHY
ncbi:unnamed protein product [Ranitomeya imitator]|uniref:Lamina-associated polypeptide 2 alpha C-terminal domain-containing protein n=1 Tax=Ranitomeya imitator TaxID=111125 RepID=A0ABN9MCI4_9NEOB|nr:unnamed protein product [Ranitomeya imitator]